MKAAGHIIITAGGTREYIDSVRFISNASSGKMGLALTEAGLKAGYKITLITTVEIEQFKAARSSSKLKIISVVSASDMFKAVKQNFPECDCLVMAAAVSDYTPASRRKTKIKKQQSDFVLKLKPTADILKWAGAHKKDRKLIGFALEDKNIRSQAEKKLIEKNLDMIIANSPAAISSDKSQLQIKQQNGKWLSWPQMTKSKSAAKIIAQIGGMLA